MEFGLTPDNRRGDDGATWVAAASDAGYAALGLSSLHLRDDAVPALLAEAGLRCHELLGLVVTDEDTTRGWADQIVGQIGRVHPTWVNTTFKVIDADTPAPRGAARPCSRRPGRAWPSSSARSGRWRRSRTPSTWPTPRATRTWVVVDSWNVTYGPTTWTDLEQLDPERIAYVQFDDGLARVGDLETEAMERRTYPGQGTFELERFATTLRERGFDGVVSLQILSAELRQLPLAEFARTALETSAPYWS